MLFPKSEQAVEVHMINTTTTVVCPTDFFLEPLIKGQEYLILPTFCFLVRNKRNGKTLLFDLGGRKDWWNLAPSTFRGVRNGVKHLEVKKDIAQILTDGGVDLKSIDYLVVSHSHWDHFGDPSTFPKGAELVVGPGFRSAFIPAYPASETGAILESDLQGRKMREIEFIDTDKIAGFQSHDFFGDGSFYILNTPGHSQGHISALARTTEDTFVFMGGDVCHYGGAFRPNAINSLPGSLTEKDLPGSARILPCSCDQFVAVHPNKDGPRETPYYHVTTRKDGWYQDADVAQESINKVEALDNEGKVLVALAHDVGFLNVATFFPSGSMNDWFAKGWKERTRWGFLDDLPINGKGKLSPIDGYWSGDKRVDLQ